MSDVVKYRTAIWSFLKLTALYFTMSDIVLMVNILCNYLNQITGLEVKTGLLLFGTFWHILATVCSVDLAAHREVLLKKGVSNNSYVTTSALKRVFY